VSGPVRQHRHHAGQVVTASGLSAKKRAWLRRDHSHTTAQITGAPANDKERAQGKQHWHDTSDVS
jgi:hypothetical protein